MAEWKKVLLSGDAAVLSDTAPVDVDTGAASAGVATDAARRDHKHDVGDMSGMTADTIAEKTATAGVTVDGVLLKDSQVTTDTILEKTATVGVTIDGCLIKDGLVADSNLLEGSNKAAVQNHAPPADSVGAAEIDSTATDIELSQIILTPKAEPTGVVEGSIFYDSDDNHLYVYVV